MAQSATARQSDVDEGSVELIRLNVAERYDHGKVPFRAKEGRLVDLDKVLESIKQTRLGERTRSELLKFEVTAAGEVVHEEDQWMLKVDGSDEHFLLGSGPEAVEEDPFAQLQQAVEQGAKVTHVTGELDGWSGVWPDFLGRDLPKPRRILVSSFETAESP